MAVTDGHTVPITRSYAAALGILVLALAPQLFELVWSLGSLVGLSTGRGPAQVLLGHGTALLSAPFGSFGAGARRALSSDALLALIYSYPLLVVALVTPFVHIRAPQDYIGGAVLMAIALFALWASSDLQGMHGFSFGAGTAPRMFALLLLGLGVAVAVMGLVVDGSHLATYHWRGPLFISLGILTFAASIRPLGLVVSGLACFLISALGTPETRWLETTIVGICLTIGCALLFPYVLGLPMPLFPRFLIQ